jgi:hypothetical protein
VKGDVKGAAPAGDPLDVATILSELVDESEYSETKSCVSVRDYDSVRILDESHLLFEGDRRIWLNRLRHRCASLRNDPLLVFERRGSKICDSDRVSGRDRRDTAMWYGSCLLGRFEQIDEQQAKALKDAIDQARRAKHGKSAPKEEES